MFPALDPIAFILFIAAFIATALATARRPALGTAALAFVPPFTFDHALLATTLSFPKMVVAGVLIGMLSHRSAALRVLRESRFVLGALAAVVAAVLLSGLHAQYHAPVARETLKWVEFSLVFALAYASYRIDPDDRIVRAALGLSIAIVCTSALAQDAIGSSSVITFGEGVAPRIAGALEGPNQLGGYLEIALAFLASLQAARPSIVWGALLALVGVCLPLTFSRAAMVGGVIATLVIIIAIREARTRLAPLYAGTLAGLAGDALWIRAAETIPSLHNVSYGRDNAGGVGHRAELWRAAWFFFRHHPLLGIGAGNYELRLPDAGVYGVRTHANNWYLQSLAEGGIVLFAATVALLATIIRGVYRVLRASPWSTAAFAATLALAAHQLVDYLVFYPKVAEPWLILVALGLAAPRSPSCD